MNMNPERIANAFGAMAEATLVMYRSAINASATRDEAKDIVEAYFGATIKHGNSKLTEGGNEKNKDWVVRLP